MNWFRRKKHVCFVPHPFPPLKDARIFVVDDHGEDEMTDAALPVGSWVNGRYYVHWTYYAKTAITVAGVGTRRDDDSRYKFFCPVNLQVGDKLVFNYTYTMEFDRIELVTQRMVNIA